jgi:hypothetical protein
MPRDASAGNPDIARIGLLRIGLAANLNIG